ncbi:MAG: hypothetical protein IPL08_04770 [Saprospiraceae bacterium]|nr:hypothetical protein [Saprospiraceae bacterium]
MATLSLAFHPGRWFSPGVFLMPAVSIAHSLLFVHSSLARHLQGDWGDCCSDDAALNDAALQDGGRLFSVYHIPAGLYGLESKLWIITDHDRSATTVLFPSEY